MLIVRGIGEALRRLDQDVWGQSVIKGTTRVSWIVATAVFVAGCSTILANNALQQLQAQCAEKGMQFVAEETKTREGIFISSAEVSGYCVGPGDPRYVPDAKAAKQPAI